MRAAGESIHVKNILILLIILLSSTLTLKALDPDRLVSQYMHRFWGQPDGLPQSTATAIIQTRDGYLWIGTQEGIARFNGKRFTTFTKEKYPVIVNDYIIALFEDREGTVWAGSREGLLAWRNGEFKRYSKAEGLENDLVRGVTQDNSGTLWVGTEGGLFYSRGNRFVRFDPVGTERVNRVRNDPFNDKVFLGTNNGLFFAKDGKMDNVDLGKKLTANIVRDILVVSEREIYVATMGAGIARIKDGVMNFISTGEGLSSSNVFRIYRDRDGNIWAGCDETGGVNRINKNGISILNEEKGLVSDSVYELGEDHEGNLWVGTVRGLVRISDGKVKMLTSREGLVSNYINPLMEENGKIYVGTDRGISVHEGGGTVQHRPRIYGKLKIFSLYRDRKGNLWVGTFGKGVFREGSDGVSHFTMKDGLPHDTVFSITGDRNGTIWFGTLSGLGRFTRGVFLKYSKNERLSNLVIYQLMTDRNGNLWVGTGGGGVDRIRRDEITNFSTKNGLSDNFVVALYEDRDGYIWAGTANGLNLIRGDRVSPINVKDGLYNGVAFTILEDFSGRFWMSSNKGIYHVPREHLLDFADGKVTRITCGVLTKEDGMGDSECNGGYTPAGWVSSDGKLLISSIAGVVVVDPAQLKMNRTKPPVRIEEVMVDGEPVLQMEKGLELSSGANRLALRFAVLSYSAVNRNRAAYILEGNDEKWTMANNTDEWVAHYTNLSPGRYTFRVKGANGDGVWNEEGTALYLYIKPFFWETLWFRVIGLILFSILSYFIISLLRKYLRVLTFWKEKHYIGRYKLIERIGAGGMGSVYKARDALSKDKVYAVKILREELFGDREQVQRLKNEGIIIDQLKHRNIVRIFERGEYSGGIYIVMELLLGKPLTHLTGKDRRPGLDEIMEIMVQISDALSFIHGKGVTHRDMKPENVMLETDDEGKLLVKLLDFGLARIDTFTKLTQTGAVMGSIHYLAPEQLTATGVSDKSDIFSTGIILYELLTGEKPFKGETAVEVMQSILTGEPGIPPGITPKMRTMLKGMLSKDQADRPDAAELKAFFETNSNF